MPLLLSRIIILLIISGFIGCTNVYAQYPFEKHPAIRYEKFDQFKIDTNLIHTIAIPDFFQHNEPIIIKFEGDTAKDITLVHIYRNQNLIKTFIEPSSIREYGPRPESVFLEDINGDGLKDLKIMIPYYFGLGAYNYYARIIYLFQNKDSSLTKVSFTDWVMDYVKISPGEFAPGFVNRPERDFDGDNNFEIITQTFQNYGKHNYMLYNLYNFDGKKLVNVNRKANYPIMIQLLDDFNYKITKKVSTAAMKRLARKLPDDYD